jgi:hypothetical protein
VPLLQCTNTNSKNDGQFQRPSRWVLPSRRIEEEEEEEEGLFKANAGAFTLLGPDLIGTGGSAVFWMT